MKIIAAQFFIAVSFLGVNFHPITQRLCFQAPLRHEMLFHSCWGCDQFPAVIALAHPLGLRVVIVPVVIASGFGLSYHFHIIDHAFVGNLVLNSHFYQ